MRAVVQRVTSASVDVDNQTVGKIGKGLLVFLSVDEQDTEADIEYTVNKITELRIFNDEEGKFNLSLYDVKGEMLVVSQFTLHGDCRRGRRPSFSTAARPEKAVPYYEKFVQTVRDKGFHVETGVFAAHMFVSLVNDGPVTILIDSKKVF
ncbi:MAG TPA: D-aminoacyl-tRNA deacylase [Candidatus Hydrogenedens sp.]|nr:D-aminoacyl-tRNA deacylase [Candidatus Hydrogenedens sp.]HOL20278.1 D-aminoacyl-tRNA deacylase [Candidatus Hydrogenedens sp.]HPP58130.1 D-aminoacyl-tRNA deacylase [Candidatus Hydrogenedens sp.]